MSIVRPYKKGDRDAVFTVCHKTGFFGEDASPHFGDKKLFGILFSSYYIDYEPENAFVVEDGKEVKGYIIGTSDTIGQIEGFSQLVIPRAIKRMFMRTIFRYPKDILFLIALKGHEEFERRLYKEELLEKYPAHLHINLLPDYQGKGLGSRLLKKFEERMRRSKVSGIHLVTSTENKKAIPFYRKMGYEVIDELPNILWDRKSPEGTKSVVFGKRLLLV